MELLRKKLLYRSWHRGCKETDIILGEFAKKFIHDLTDDEIKSFEVIVESSDQVLYDTFVREVSIPDEFDRNLFEKIIIFNKERAPGENKE